MGKNDVLLVALGTGAASHPARNFRYYVNTCLLLLSIGSQ